jgi:hypothetical protein
MTKAFWAVGFMTLASSGLHAGTVFLDLTGLPDGTLLTNQVADQGVVFSGEDVGVFTGTDYFNTVLGTTNINFVSGVDPGVTDSLTLTEPSINTDYDSFFDGATVSAYDINGDLLETQTFEPEGPYVGTLPATSLTFNDAGINELTLVGIEDYAGGGAFPLELSFDTITSPTPEPAAIWLTAAGLAGAALLRRRSA